MILTNRDVGNYKGMCRGLALILGVKRYRKRQLSITDGRISLQTEL